MAASARPAGMKGRYVPVLDGLRAPSGARVLARSTRTLCRGARGFLGVEVFFVLAVAT